MVNICVCGSMVVSEIFVGPRLSVNTSRVCVCVCVCSLDNCLLKHVIVFFSKWCPFAKGVIFGIFDLLFTLLVTTEKSQKILQ